MSRSSRISLRLLEDRFAVCRLPPDEKIPPLTDASAFQSITRTPTELSIVCRESPDLPGRVEAGWRCLVVDGILEFDQVGILAGLAQPLAEAGVSIFVVSTFDTDYLLVKEDQLSLALKSLQSAGHIIL
jgi:hypothetical protein